MTTSCTFTDVSATLSPKIATVGIVTFATDLKGLTSAKIDFGLTTEYGYTAPVDIKEANHRTLLLGMKPSKMYHYRISATGPSGTCMGTDATIMTGAKGGGLSVTPTPKSAPKALGGFLIFGNYAGTGASVVDADGDTVWWYTGGGDISGARMSYDGKYMWTLADNCCTDRGANVHRVSMDGMTDDNLSDKFKGANHMLTVLPDETVAFFAYGANGCDDIKEYTPSTGVVRTIVNVGKANGATNCHTNQVQYSLKDDTLVFSDLNSSSITKVKRSDGSTVWVLNGAHSTLGTVWTGGQHGISILDVDRLVIFNNPSTAIEVKIDLGAKTAMKVWSYKSAGSTSNHGDVQRLPNGNTMVMPSQSSQGFEVAPDGTLIQSLRMSGGYGFMEKRLTMYGPPIRDFH